MEFKKSGNRVCMENVHFERREALSCLVMGELKENKERFYYRGADEKTAQNINFEQSFLLFFHIRTILEFETHTPTSIGKVVRKDTECAYFACILHMSANTSAVVIIAYTHNTQSL